MQLAEAAAAYLRAGLSVLPARVRQKRPALSTWKAYQSQLPAEAELGQWFNSAEGLCLIAGAVSGNLEMLDFDLAGEAFPAWVDGVRAADSALYEKLVIERSPSGGFHVAYRCQSPVCGNQKLAQRKHVVDGPAEVTIVGKSYKPRRDPAGQWHVLLTTIEPAAKVGCSYVRRLPGTSLSKAHSQNCPCSPMPSASYCCNPRGRSTRWRFRSRLRPLSSLRSVVRCH
jgi:hypothetical protein